MADSEPWRTLGRGYEASRSLIADPTREVYVAEDDDGLAGFLILCTVGPFTGYLQTLCLAPGRRGQGIGTRLVAFAEERLFAISPNVFLCVSSFNDGARRLYPRLGYEYVGELRDYLVRGHSELLYRKTRGPWQEFTAAEVLVRPFETSDAGAVQTLVLGIQRDEFGVPITLAEQPDLGDVPAHYFRGGGCFWVATDQGQVIGTIGLLDIGGGRGALRKMFVAPSHRGSARGVGARLLATCLQWAKAHGMVEVLLGTTEHFQAAHRFYRKAGFVEVAPAELPADFPRMPLDTRFFSIRLDAHSGAPPPPA